MESFKKINWKNKKVFLRVDLNLTVNKGKVEEAYKLDSVLPTIQYLLKQGAQIRLFSHLGRPDGKKKSEFSLRPVFNVLKKRLPKIKIRFIEENISKKLLEKVDKMSEPLIFFENIRFYKGEEKNDVAFSKLLSSFGDIFVNDSFACAHRNCASISGVSNYITTIAGLRLQKEVEFLNKALMPQKKSTALIGGAKVSTKILVLSKFIKIYDQVLLGGALANTFFKALGYGIGDSYYEPEMIKKAKKLMKEKNLLLPIDVVVKVKNSAICRNIGDNNICGTGEKILDIGPRTVTMYSEIIKKSQMIIWSGPMGMIEEKKFRHGSLIIAKVMGSVASGKAVGIAGGGETVWAIEQAKMSRYFDFISTGGGAMLEFLEGKKLPGLKFLNKKNKDKE